MEYALLEEIRRPIPLHRPGPNGGKIGSARDLKTVSVKVVDEPWSCRLGFARFGPIVLVPPLDGWYKVAWR